MQRVSEERRRQTTGRPSRLTELQKDTLVNHYNNGSTQKELAQEFSVSVTTVRRVLKERR